MRFGMASSIISNQTQWKLTIPETHCYLGKVFYHINVQIGNVSWIVKRRYSEFAELNVMLTRDQGLNKDLLPPKKFVGNLDPRFIDQRRGLLELYLNRIFQLLLKTMPTSLANFLDLGNHDVMFIIKDIPRKLISDEAKLSVLEVHSLSARLKLPCPPVDMIGYQHDISSLLESCSRTISLRIEGSAIKSPSAENPPTMDFIPFKALKFLQLTNVPPDLIVSADALRNTLESLSWNNSGLTSIEDALLCDSVHKNQFEYRKWAVSEVNFSKNSIKCVGSAATLVPESSSFDVSSNRIESMEGLNSLKKLQKLDVSDNGISCFLELKIDQRLACLRWINLSNNQLSSLKGLGQFKSLNYLNVSSNAIANFDEISHLRPLPHLTDLIMDNNPIGTNCDYRVKVLELFEDRASFVSVDGVPPSRKELDKVAVLQALRMVKEGRSPL